MILFIFVCVSNYYCSKVAMKTGSLTCFDLILAFNFGGLLIVSNVLETKQL